MLNRYVMVASTIGDLAGLPLGTRIATNHNKLLVLDYFAGGSAWFEEAALTPYSPIVDWLPAYILPPPVDPRADIPRETVCELRMEDDEEEMGG